MNANLAEHAITAVLSAAGGGGVFKIIDALNSRSKAKAENRAYAMGAVDHAVETAMKSVTDEVQRLNGVVKTQGEEIDDLRDKHRQCEDDNAAQRREAAELRAQIDALMKGPIASYGDLKP